jgi:hypothetical protein
VVQGKAPSLAPLWVPMGGGGGICPEKVGDQALEDVRSVSAVKVEVGKIVGHPNLPYLLVILSESWPDWLPAISQDWVHIVLCCDYKAGVRHKAKSLSLMQSAQDVEWVERPALLTPRCCLWSDCAACCLVPAFSLLRQLAAFLLQQC